MSHQQLHRKKQRTNEPRLYALRQAAEAVAPGGTLLVVGHDLLNLTEGWGGPKEPDVLFTPDDVIEELGGLHHRYVRRAAENHGPLDRIPLPTSPVAPLSHTDRTACACQTR